MDGDDWGRKPDYVINHKVARYLRVPVWELDRVPVHYQQEARIIMRAEREARFELASRHKCPVVNIPEF